MIFWGHSERIGPPASAVGDGSARGWCPVCCSEWARVRGGADSPQNGLLWAAVYFAIRLPARMATALLSAYKRYISPALPPSCRYTPTCSEYAQEAVARYGILYGGLLAAWRLVRCNPLAKGGYDPVPSPHVDCWGRRQTP